VTHNSLRQARLESLGEGRFRLEGVLDASTATRILEEGNACFARESGVQLDLAGVAAVDSAGLALLIEWLRGARERGQKMQFLQLPAQLQALARISEIESLLSGSAS
jgi:phospholipid transport system transporter-binding protein